VSDDSRQVRPGDLFMAYPGDLEPTAAATSPMPLPTAPRRSSGKSGGTRIAWNRTGSVANLPVTGLRALCGPLAHAVYGQPSERLSLIAVTGTNGKTSVSQWIGRQPSAPLRVIGTLGAGLPGESGRNRFHDTPEATTLMRVTGRLRQCRCAGLRARGQFDRHCRRAPRRGARRRRGVYQSHARSSRLPRFDGRYAAGQGKRLFTWPRLRLAVAISTIPSGVELAAYEHGDEGARLHARRRRRRPARDDPRRERRGNDRRLAFPPLRTERSGLVETGCSAATTSPICWRWPPY
jgi:hypothetical protein